MAYATISKPSLHFNTKLYTGTGSSNAITGVGFQPDWTWIKVRSNGTYGHALFDSVRGVNKPIQSNSTSAEGNDASGSYTSLNSFDSDGFTLGGYYNKVNQSGQTFVSWNWKASGSTASNTDGSITSTVSANTTAGFSIVTYTGTGSTTTVGHGLGVKPEIVIYKERNNTNSWRVMTDLDGGTLKRIYLNVNDAATSIIDSSTAPTSTVLNIGTGSEINRDSNATYVAYCFASIKGFSKFGTYTGNGNDDGTFVYTGFKPEFVMVKAFSGADSWQMTDHPRDANVSPNFARLLANATSAESTNTTWAKIEKFSNGFKLRGTDGVSNQNGRTFLFMAYAEEPLVANVGASIPATAR